MIALQNLISFIMYLIIIFNNPDLRDWKNFYQPSYLLVNEIIDRHYNFKEEYYYSHYTRIYNKIPKFATTTISISHKYNVDPYLITAIMLHESEGGKQYIRGNAGEYGLMQVMPFHFEKRNIPVSKRFDVETNVTVGTEYFKWCLINKGHNIKKALTCYNAGPGYPGYRTEYISYVMRHYSKLTSNFLVFR
jgi:soluble lytic murein transglycosylase-like protein